MSVNYPQPLINSRLQLVVNAVDAGPSNGFLRLLDASNNIVSSFQLSKPSMTVGGGVAVFNGLSLIDPSAAGGAPATARVEDSTGAIVIFGLTIPTDIAISPDAVILPGQVVVLTAATITGH